MERIQTSCASSPGGLDVDLVHELHQAHVAADLLLPVERRRAGAVLDAVEFPDIAVVVPIRDRRHVRARVEARAGDLELVRKAHPHVPGQAVVVEPTRFARERFPTFRHQRMRVAVLGVEQRAGEPRQQCAGAFVGRIGNVQGQPQLAQPRKLADGERLDAGVLDHADHPHLQRGQRLGGKRRPRIREMCGGVGGGGAVQLEAAHGAARVVRVGQMDDAVRDEGPVALPGFEVAAGGPQEEIAPPQRAQVHPDAPLHIDEEGAAALLLQHGEGVRTLQPKVADLRLEVGAVRLGAPHRPAAQSPEGELREQGLEAVEHRPHAPRRLGEEFPEQAQVAAEDLDVAQAAGGERRGGAHHGDDGAARLRRHAEGRLYQLVDGVLADLPCDLRCALDERDHEVGAAAQGLERARAAQVGFQPARREHARRLVPGGAQHFGRVVAELGQELVVVVELDGHGEWEEGGAGRGEGIHLSLHACPLPSSPFPLP